MVLGPPLRASAGRGDRSRVCALVTVATIPDAIALGIVFSLAGRCLRESAEGLGGAGGFLDDARCVR